MCNIAVVSVHTSPLARPGTRDSGGLNVYVRSLGREMARRGHTMDVFTRRTDADSPEITLLDDANGSTGRTRVIQIAAGPLDADKRAQRRHLEEFRRGVAAFQERNGLSYDLVHSHYWMSEIGRAVAVGIGVSDSATAGTRIGLVRVVRANVVAVRCAVAVGIGVGDPATAGTRIDLVRVVRASVVAICRAVAVGIGVSDSASANARIDLVRVVRTSVVAVGCSVAVGIGIRSAAAMCCRS